jgi:hypothetical protein
MIRKASKLGGPLRSRFGHCFTVTGSLLAASNSIAQDCAPWTSIRLHSSSTRSRPVAGSLPRITFALSAVPSISSNSGPSHCVTPIVRAGSKYTVFWLGS